MADCSASGTTIDRAARAVLGAAGNGSNNASVVTASKHVGALLGHAAMSSTGHGNSIAAGMPLMNPDHLVLPSASMPMAGTTPSATVPVSSAQIQTQHSTSHLDAAWNQRNIDRHQTKNPTTMTPIYSPAPQQHGGMMMNPMQHMHHQQQMQFQMHIQQQQQQQQQLAMMVQQQQFFQQQQQKKLRQQKLSRQSMKAVPQKQQSVSSTAAASETELALEGHHGIVEGASMEQLAAAWAQAEAEYDQEQIMQHDDNVTVGDEYAAHDGVVRGASIEELASAWELAEREYDQVLLDSQVTSDYGTDEEYANLWQGDAMADQEQVIGPYQFVNPISKDDIAEASADSVNYMDEGMKFFQEGNLKEAIYSFEMELQQRDPDNATAWRMLGRCHAENDQDPDAIKCLEAAVDRDPYSPETLLALGVSYVNELNHDRALENMKAWFTHNPKYAGMELPIKTTHQEDIFGAGTDGSHKGDSTFDEVKSMLEAALEIDPTDAADIHEALGVIYNVIKDFEAAATSFRKALETRPDDYQLWNKLGATLANGSESDQALLAYHRALKIKPKYARAWLNMAISHSNLQDHHEAARCYLQTLSLNPSATHCWTYLRMALSSQEKWDLLPLVFSRDLDGFRQEFDFVLY